MSIPPSHPDDQLANLQALAEASLHLWNLPQDAAPRLINVSENATFLVEAASGKAVLRIHRPNYHTRAAIRSELLWARALQEAGVVETPRPQPGRNGEWVQNAQPPGFAAPRHMVLFDYLSGDHPDESKDLTAGFRQLGQMAAGMHIHSGSWIRPQPFQRMTWDLDAVFAKDAHWGDWRLGPNLTRQDRDILEAAERKIKRRLTDFGKHPDRYGLIHADMRLANLIVGPDGATRLIDFDDCGFGWHLYDFAAAISFIEDHPQVPALKAAWLAGYHDTKPLGAAEIAELDTFVMLRRMALLAWIGSHLAAPEPQALAPHFAAGTARLARDYLAAQE